MVENQKIWRIEVHRQVEKSLKRLPGDVVSRIWTKIKRLQTDPRPKGCVKLDGYETLYRIRVGDFRVIYAIEDELLIVLVLEIGLRGSVYRKY